LITAVRLSHLLRQPATGLVMKRMLRDVNDWAAVILAAGQGKRMRSSRPKVLHTLAGRPMVRHVAGTLQRAGFQRPIVVVGQGRAQVREALGDGFLYVDQRRRLGTGHALRQAEPLASAAAHVLVLNGDIPLISAETVSALAARHRESGADLTFLTAHVEDSRGLARLQRDGDGRPVAVVEEADYRGPSGGPAEINVGVYCFLGSWLWPRLRRLPRSGSGEYYLTELIARAARDGDRLQAVVASEPGEAIGINDRLQLAEAEAVMRERIRRRHLLAGVTMINPSAVYIDADVEVGRDTVLWPNTYLAGSTHVGEGCVLGPDAFLVDSRVGARCRVVSSVVEGAVLEDDVAVGPFSHLRPGSYIEQGAHVGNFAEVKNARLGRRTRMGHFSYVGDAQVGRDVNIGAGAITCNFDGTRKQRTIIGDRAFIGSDTMLVAPVEVGERSATGAGSVVNRDVPPDSLAVGAPARIRPRRARRSKKA
jgi:bifunctional UDP-N-acetylglucosamine pyrophosphorylase/glucosamine-1-phosphate N-acetyltransferase